MRNTWPRKPWAARWRSRCRPMFLPFALRGMQLANRVVVSPMSMYSADQGLPSDWHLVHYGPPGPGRRGPGLHRDDRHQPRGPHHRGLPRSSGTTPRPRPGPASWTLCPQPYPGQNLYAAGPFRPQGQHPEALGERPGGCSPGRWAAGRSCPPPPRPMPPTATCRGK